jgi:hypothetical protein
MSMKRRWLRALFLVMMTVSSFGGAPMNPKEIEDLLHVMNETKVEFSLPDEGDKGDGNPPWKDANFVRREEAHAPGGEDAAASET